MTPQIIIGVCAAIITAAAMNLLVEADPESRSQQVKRVLSKQRINLPVAIITLCVMAVALNVAYGIVAHTTPMLPVAGSVILAVQSASLREENKFDPLLFIVLMLSPRLPREGRAQLRLPSRAPSRAASFSFARPAFGSPRRKTLRGEDQIKTHESGDH